MIDYRSYLELLITQSRIFIDFLMILNNYIDLSRDTEDSDRRRIIIIISWWC